MTCAHVLGLIDAGPFADYPKVHLDAAWHHARACATCGPTLTAATTLARDLSALPRPAPPPDMAAAIMTRIREVDVVPASPEVEVASGAADRPPAQGWPAWATTLGGLSAAIAIVLSMPPGPEAGSSGVASSRSWAEAILVALPSLDAWAVISTSLVLYVVGLFAPIRERSRS